MTTDLNIFSDTPLPELSDAELDEIVGRFPHARRLLEVAGSVDDYYAGLTVDGSTFRAGRAEVFLAALRRHIDDLLPPGTSAGVIDQLTRSPLMSAAEHMASITNPESLNVVINQALYRRQREQTYVLSLPITAIRLDNILLSRDLFAGDRRVRLLPSKYRDTLATDAPAADPAFVERNLRAAVADGPPHLRARAAELQDWWERAYRDISSLDALWKQLVVLNHSYWKELVRTNDWDLPDEYVTVPMCVLVRDVMIEELEAGRDGWFYDMILDPATRDAVYRTFDGVRSCWDSKSKGGTFLFWTTNKRGEPRAMTYEAGALRSTGAAGTLPLSRESLLDALRSGALYPGTFLVMAYLGFYLGLQLFGGILCAQFYPEMYRRITTGNPLGLDTADLKTIEAVRTDLYVNFERRELADGGLLKLWYPQSADVFREYRDRPFRREIMGCLGYLLEMVRKGEGD
ncbi:hypothetical protein [Streptomyces purpurogeneiscleroticus]|uniref:hypothetical protein n=1 Tax=Streptomyces purpurogeneiscleroticus TaxID=68259 RepID=UPI001CBC90EF|nr:hypothetical protein [Streptomyces purpurogeneiscleroticus]MBZ4015235.1 hypothetical protein [Streptomyces purpurogeneiscleroticus]